MHVAVQLEFKADRKEPLGVLVRRVAALFESAGLQPQIEASFSDGPAILRSTSAVERAIRKYPHLAPLERNDAPRLRANLPPIRRLTNLDSSMQFPLSDVLARQNVRCRHRGDRGSCTGMARAGKMIAPAS
jgi:hypothetical protein